MHVEVRDRAQAPLLARPETWGRGTSVLDETGCAAQQGVHLRLRLCDRVSCSDKNYATGYYN